MNEERANCARQRDGYPRSWPAVLTLKQALNVARATMRCTLCYWSTYEREPCPEQEYVTGCIHWKPYETQEGGDRC